MRSSPAGMMTGAQCASLAFGLVLLTSLVSAEQAPVFEPASFIDNELSIEKTIRFPKVDGAINHRVACAGHVTRSGKMRSPVCYGQNRRDLFAREVVRRARRARLIPARVDGKIQTVWFQFGVWFQRDVTESIVVVSNNGAETERLGAGIPRPRATAARGDFQRV